MDIGNVGGMYVLNKKQGGFLGGKSPCFYNKMNVRKKWDIA